MSTVDMGRGGGYNYQWECAMLLALNCFFDPVPDELYNLVADFLGEVAELHLEGVEIHGEGVNRQLVELEDINLTAGNRRLLIQVKTTGADWEIWRPSDTALRKALYRFYDSPFLTDQSDNTLFVFLTNRQFNEYLSGVARAMRESALDERNVDSLFDSLKTYARSREEPTPDADRFRTMLSRTRLIQYVEEDYVKSNVQRALQAYGHRNWAPAHALLKEHFIEQSILTGGGIVTRESIVGVLGRPEHPSRRDLELAYLDRLVVDYGHWSDGYTHLPVEAEVRAVAPNDQAASRRMSSLLPRFEMRGRDGSGRRIEGRHVEFDDVREAVAKYRRILLLGEPGSGKTTTLERLVYDYADAARDDDQKPLPLLVKLGGYTDSGSFENYLAHSLGRLAPYLEDYRASGRLVLLLDGLNEMPRAGYAARAERIQSTLKQWPQETMVVVTCRRLDHVVNLGELQEFEILPLDEARMLTFLQNYLGDMDGERLFWDMAGGREIRALWETWEQAGGTWDEFWTANYVPNRLYQQVYQQGVSTSQQRVWEQMRREPPYLLVLGRVAYFLWLIAGIYNSEEGELPANRGLLFRDFVVMLLTRERTRHLDQWIAASVQQEALTVLAYAMQAEGGHGTAAERSWAATRLHEAMPAYDPEQLLNLATSATLLQKDGARVSFYHQLLQEYFAACEMGHRLAGSESLDQYWPPDRWWEPSGWEVTATLLAEIEPDATAFLYELCRANPLVAARCLLEGSVQVGEEVRHHIVDALVGATGDGSLPAVARAGAGDLLAPLGDPRPGVGLRADGLPDIAWCKVPAGPFLMGSDKRRDELAQDNEPPQHTVDLPDYSVAKYPVTNAQYAVFVAKGGYSERRYWIEAGWRWKGKRSGPATWGGVFDLPNHPVVRVTWYEAVAFCRWLTERMRETEDIGTEQAVRLPTEAEWEKAARGPDGRLYPWGAEFDLQKCNAIQTGIGTSSVVGCFPAGVSPYGAEDLSGNVLEWCDPKWRGGYEESADESLDADASLAVRGGSFYHGREFMRCAARIEVTPDYSHWMCGFRVVVAPVPAEI